MNIELKDHELEIIKKGLKDLIDKDGISEAQELYLHNIDNGMSEEDAEKQFQLDNKKDWDFMINEKKILFIVYIRNYLLNKETWNDLISEINIYFNKIFSFQLVLLLL